MSRYNWYFQTSCSPTMDKIIDLHNDIMVFLVFILIFISWMLGRIIYLFRSQNKNTIRFRFQHNSRLEQIWTIIPALLLLLIATPSFSLLYSLDESSMFTPKMTLHVIGNQWYWTYNYPEIITSIKGSNVETLQFDSYMLTEENLPKGGFRLLEVDNMVYLPVQTNIRVLVTSRDVLHSWAIPALGVKVDACPGRINQISLYIKRTGTFYGQCSELCGVQHSFMPIAVKAIHTYN